MTVIVEVPGHGEVEFPDGMSDQEMEAAIRRNFMLPPKQQPKQEFNTMQKRMGLGKQGDTMEKIRGVVDNAGYNVGGFVTDQASKVLPPEAAAAAGYVANVATDTVPALLGGEAFKLAASPGMQAGAKKLMQSALKPGVADLRSGKAAKAVDTLLEKGINPTQGGVAQLRSHIDELNAQVEQIIANSPATVNKAAVGSHLKDTWAAFKNQVNPQADLETIRKAWDAFKNHPSIAGKMDIPVQLAQEIKQGTYRVLNKKYGQMGSAEVEAQKGLARGLKEEISKAVPQVGPINKAESELINALTVAEKRALMDANKNPMGLALLANNPASWAAFMADKSALFKSIIARMMHSGSERIPQVVGSAAGGLYGAQGSTEGLY